MRKSWFKGQVAEQFHFKVKEQALEKVQLGLWMRRGVLAIGERRPSDNGFHIPGSRVLAQVNQDIQFLNTFRSWVLWR